MLDYIYLFLAGICGGFLAGLLGIGGGILYILILPLALMHIGVPSAELVQYVIANSIFGTLFASLSGNVALIRNKRFYRNEVLVVGLLATVSSLFVLNFIIYTTWYSRQVFNIVVILLLSFIVFNVIRHSNPKNKFIREVPFSKRKLGLAGLAGGVVAALSGLGGGTVIVPLLNSAMKMNIKKAKSISLGMISIASLFMTLFNMLEAPVHNFPYLRLGFIVFPVVVPLSFGVVIGSPFGVKMGRKIPSFIISYIFSIFVLVVIIGKMIGLLRNYFSF